MLNIFKRKKTNLQKRHIAAGMPHNILSNWQSQSSPINHTLYQSLPLLRARSREAALNNDHVVKFLQQCQQHIVGHQGVQLQCRSRNNPGDNPGDLNTPLNNHIEQQFKRWGQACDVSGQLSWLDVQRLIISTVARDGEVLVRLHRGFDNDFGFALELIECDKLDTNHNENLSNHHRIVMGIEVNQYNKPLAYHFTDNHHDNTLNPSQQRQRLPATDVIHIFDRQRPQQSRGIPWLHSALVRLQMLAGYEEAELVAARLGASKMGFFEQNDLGEGYRGDNIDDSGQLITEAVPGSFENLPQGVKFNSWNPEHPSGNYGNFIKACLRGIASGLGLAYNNLANDLEGVNYSSIRAGLLDERDHWMQLQQWFIQHACQPIYDAWLPMAMLSGVIDHDGSYQHNQCSNVTWQARRWPWVDPQKDLAAIEKELQLRLTSLSEVIRRLGRDPDEVLQQIAHSKQQLKTLGLNDILESLYDNP